MTDPEQPGLQPAALPHVPALIDDRERQQEARRRRASHELARRSRLAAASVAIFAMIGVGVVLATVWWTTVRRPRTAERRTARAQVSSPAAALSESRVGSSSAERATSPAVDGLDSPSDRAAEPVVTRRFAGQAASDTAPRADTPSSDEQVVVSAGREPPRNRDPTSASAAPVAEAPPSVAPASANPVASASPAARSELTSSTERWLDAYYRRDRTAMASLQSRGMKVSDERTPDERLPEGLDAQRALEGVTFHIVGEGAVVSGKMIEQAHVDGRILQSASWISQVWIREDEEWRLIDVRLLSDSSLK